MPPPLSAHPPLPQDAASPATSHHVSLIPITVFRPCNNIDRTSLCAYTFSATLFSVPTVSSDPPTYPLVGLCGFQHTLLCQKQSVALLDGDPVPRVLVVGRETSGMRALADFAIDDLLQRVDALGRVLRVGNVHEMHAVKRSVLRSFRLISRLLGPRSLRNLGAECEG